MTTGVIEAPRVRTRRRRANHALPFFLFTGPLLLGLTIFTFIPIIWGFLLSFSVGRGSVALGPWVGLQNYETLIQDAGVWWSLSRTLLFSVIVVPLSVAGSLGLAVLLNQRLRARGFFRTVFFAPSIVPVVATVIMWRLIFDHNAGALNAILERFGIPAVTWLVDPTAFFALVVLSLWGLGGGMVIMLAGLQGVPVELEEAAIVDGAGRWRTFRHVTLPMLSPVIFFQVVTGTIASLQVVVQPLLLAQTNSIGAVTAVPHGNLLYMVSVYQQFFTNQQFGYGSAMLWLFFLIILAITLLVLRSSTFWVYYEVDSDT